MSGSGRILVPVNFRLVAEEVTYIVEHSGARILLIDPELEEAMQDVECEMKWIIGSETDDKLMRYDLEPAAWEPDEDATATINYTSGTTARPKGVQLTHRNGFPQSGRTFVNDRCDVDVSGVITNLQAGNRFRSARPVLGGYCVVLCSRLPWCRCH